MNYGTKVQLLTLINHIVLAVGIYYTHNWSLLYLGLVMYVFVGLFAANIFMHTYLSYSTYETRP